ncbi:TPA: hypothetical protein ACH3X1_013260 [Trebouxia sp. C0004]
MLQKAAVARPVPKALAAKADLPAAEKKILPELGPALLYQAVLRSLFIIASFFVDNGVDVTDCPAYTFDTERVASPLLLLIQAAQEDSQNAQADSTDGVLMVASERRSFIVQEMLDAVLSTWSMSKTARAVHSGMHPHDQKTVLEWMLAHQGVTITRFAQSKNQQRKLVQLTIDAKSLGLLKMLVMGPDLKLNCSGCLLHGIVADAPLELLVTLMEAAGTALDTQHPILKTYVIHEDEEERHKMALLLLTAAPTLSLVANYNMAKGALQTPLNTIKHKKKLKEWFVVCSRTDKPLSLLFHIQ